MPVGARLRERDFSRLFSCGAGRSSLGHADARRASTGQARYLQDDRPIYLPGGGRRGGRREGSERKEGRGEGRGGKRVAEPQMARRAFVRASVPLGVNQREKCKCMCCVYLQTKRSSTRFWKWRATGDGADGSHRCSAVNYAARREGMKENWAPMGATARGGGSDLH